MKLMHHPAEIGLLHSRLQSLSAIAVRRWGTMTVGQMLWHCNRAMESALGTMPISVGKLPPLPRGVLKFLVLNLPWPKGAPTGPALVATGEHDFEAERARCFRLLDAMTAKPLTDIWPWSPAFGNMTGADWSRFMAKHLDHHLRQFSA